jgi:hypothetical protein
MSIGSVSKGFREAIAGGTLPRRVTKRQGSTADAGREFLDAAD